MIDRLNALRRYAPIVRLVMVVSALLLAATMIVSPLASLRAVVFPVFVVAALLLPFFRRWRVLFVQLCLLALAAFVLGSLIDSLSFLAAAGVMVAVVVVIADSFGLDFATDKTRRAEGDAPSPARTPDIPPNGPVERQGLRLSQGLYLLTTVLVFLNPFQLRLILRQMYGQSQIQARLEDNLPDAKTYRQQVRYTLPFTGEWYVANGGIEQGNSHSWDVLTQRYAYDFIMTDFRLRRHDGSGSRLSEYFCYDQPILAPADGIVVEVCDGVRDAPRPGSLFIDFLARDFRGNYVIIRHAEDEYSFLAHLIPGSISVKVGDEVQLGQLIGRCGNSGHSSEPHLHFHVQDGPDFFTAMGLPVQFDDVTADGAHHESIHLAGGMRVEAGAKSTSA